MSPLAQDLRRILAGFIAGRTAFPEVATAFTLASWDAPENDPEAYALAGDAALLIAEFTSGHRSEHSLRDALRELHQAFSI